LSYVGDISISKRSLDITAAKLLILVTVMTTFPCFIQHVYFNYVYVIIFSLLMQKFAQV